MTNLARSIEIQGTTHEIQDSCALPTLNSDQESRLLGYGDYRGDVIANNKVFLASDGAIKRYTITQTPESEITNIQFVNTETKSNHDIRACAWDGHKFVAVDAQEGTVLWSNDGIEWINKGYSPVYGIDWLMIYHDNAYYLYSGYGVYKSTDGIEFEYFDPNISFYQAGVYVCFCKDYFFCVNNDDRQGVYYSADMHNWTKIAGPEGQNISLYGVIYVNGKYMFFAESNSGSVDASTMTGWTPFEFTEQYEWDPYAYAYCQGKDGAWGVGFFNDRGPMRTTDGLTWTPIENFYMQWPMIFGSTADGLGYAYGDSYLWITADGLTWTEHEASFGGMSSIVGGGTTKVLFPGYQDYDNTQIITYDGGGGQTIRTLVPIGGGSASYDAAKQEITLG